MEYIHYRINKTYHKFVIENQKMRHAKAFIGINENNSLNKTLQLLK